MTLVGLAIVLTALNFSVIFVAFDEITGSLNASDAAASWALTGFTIAMGALVIPAGWLADRYGRKNILLAGLIVFVVGSAVIASAPNIGVLVAGRVVQAAGLSMESIAALALVLEAFGPDRRSTAVGGIGGIGGVAVTLGPPVGGLLLDSMGWRWVFAINVPVGIGLIALLYFALHVGTAAAPAHREAPDGTAIAGLVVGATLSALAVVQANTWGFLSGRTIGTGAIGVIALVAVVLRSRERTNAILHLPLYRDRSFRLGSALNLLIAGSFAGMYLAWVKLLNDGWGFSDRRTGLALSVIPLMGGPLSVLAGRLADRYGHRAVMLPGTALMTASGVFGLVTLDGDASLVRTWLPFGLIYGCGVGLAHSASHATAMQQVPVEHLGIGGAMSRIAMDVGSTLSVALVVALSLDATPAVAVDRACIVLVVVGIAGMAISAFLPPLPRHMDTPEPHTSRRRPDDVRT